MCAISAYVKAMVYVAHAPVHIFAPHQVNLLALDENMCSFLTSILILPKRHFLKGNNLDTAGITHK
jgi:hypothetical protein